MTDLRKRLGALVTDGFFNGMSGLGRLHPQSRPAAHGLTVTADQRYLSGEDPAHLYDVYRPSSARPGDALPVVLYVHGGGFRILSKDTHWVMALALARRGYVVFNVNYRLSGQAPFPAAVEDVCAAYQHVVKVASQYGGDPGRLIVAGESAGGNLAAVLAVAACFRRDEPYARAVFDTGVVPQVVLPACALLQVTDPGRFSRRRRLLAVVQDRIDEVAHGYLGSWGIEPHGHPTLDLADPLLLFEGPAVADRPLPAFFVPCGTADPLLDDSRRLATALRARGAPVEEAYYPGGVHAFHAFVFNRQARECWGDTYRYLDKHFPPRKVAA